MPYLEQGSGPTLVLVNGGVSDNRTWAEIMPLLANDLRVIAPTLRYYGELIGATIGRNPRTTTLSRGSTPRFKCEEIKANPVPVTWAVGTETAEVFKLVNKFYQSCLPEGSIETIQGADHGWPRTDPKAFVAAVKKFALEHEK